MYTRLEPAAFHPTEEQLEDEDEDVARQVGDCNYMNWPCSGSGASQ